MEHSRPQDLRAGKREDGEHFNIVPSIRPWYLKDACG